MSDRVDVTGPIEIILWLAVLVESPGVCIVCRHLSGWRHPVHGPVHLDCIARAMSACEDDGPPPVAPAVVAGRRGAYSRRGAA